MHIAVLLKTKSTKTKTKLHPRFAQQETAYNNSRPLAQPAHLLGCSCISACEFESPIVSVDLSASRMASNLSERILPCNGTLVLAKCSATCSPGTDPRHSCSPRLCQAFPRHIPKPQLLPRLHTSQTQGTVTWITLSHEVPRRRPALQTATNSYSPTCVAKALYKPKSNFCGPKQVTKAL